MKEPVVILIEFNDYAFYVKYAYKSYGNPALASFRTNKKNMWNLSQSIM